MSEVVVVGAGIGGLATAVALARRGHEVTVLERSEELAELGAGIQLAPNGIRALDQLGVGPAVRDIAVAVDELRFMDGVTGRHVTSLPLDAAYRRRFGNPYVVVHRGELYRLLLAACSADDRIDLRPGSRAIGYVQHGARAGVRLAVAGEQVSGDAVVGADGVSSAIRAQLVGDGPPRVAGITAYRAIVPMDEVPDTLRSNTVTWWTGPDCHLVHYPIAGGELLNLAASHADGVTEQTSGVPAAEDVVAGAMAALGPSAQALLALGREWRSWALVDRAPVDRWTDGRVTLLGDAAHPQLHYLAQGACVGLEDAVLLGELLDCPAEAFPERLLAYEGMRRERTARMQRTSRESIRLWHAAGDAASARNAALAAMSHEDLYERVAWMHDGPEAPGLAAAA